MPHLLTPQRLGPQETTGFDEHRSPFEVDADKIMYSDAFRRLQDKTQVHGLSGSDYVRTRLTHSLEASRIARSLGMTTADPLLRRIGDLGPLDLGAADVSHVVLAAALAHDLGNPPWGHSGEDMISGFFRDHPLGQEITAELPPAMQTEVRHFEGNAQGFRILVRSGGWRPDGGLKLTAATLATFTKYPFAADSQRSRAKKHKYGFFASEAAIFAEVAARTGLQPHASGEGWCRHPLSHLVEAADDCAYLIADLEDGVVLGLVDFHEAEELLGPIAGCCETPEYRTLATDHSRLLCLRSRAIKRLVDATSRIFLAELGPILDGSCPGDLVDRTPYGDMLARIRRFSRERLYRSARRIEVDVQGHVVLTTILGQLTTAFRDRQRHGDGLSLHGRRILSLMPGSATVGHEPADYVPSILDFVSSLTDQAAVRLAQTLRGSS